jgi:hypothetical protein
MVEITKDFLDSFKGQIKILENLQKSVEDGIATARRRYDLLNEPGNLGKSYEDVIAADQKQNPQGRGDKDDRHKDQR